MMAMTVRLADVAAEPLTTPSGPPPGASHTCGSVTNMADEPESLVLVHLREMRSQLQGITAELLTITAKLEEHDRRFDENDRRFDGLNMLVNHALGFGATNYVRTREAWQRRADKRLERIERRLDKLEAA
jgi:hypothetical protein